MARIVARKDAPANGEGPTLNASHVDAPLPDISHAYVKPKKKKRRIVAKQEAMHVTMHKSDAMQQVVWGVALEPDTVDSQGDTIRPEEIEKAAHNYLIKAVRGQNTVHKIQHQATGFHKDKPSIVPVESYVAPADFKFTPNGDTIKKGSWVLAAKIEDPNLWADVLAGKFTGWSIGGSGLRTPVSALVKDDVTFADSGTHEANEVTEDDEAESRADQLLGIT